MERLLTAEELAEKLQVQPDTVRAWTRNGLIPAVQLTGKVIRYDAEEVCRAVRSRPGHVPAGDETKPGEGENHD